MSRTMKVAVVQMDAAPAPVDSRLARAADLIAEAASGGAQLVVLPEVFNTGYEYTDENYSLAEPINGPTATWMKEQAKTHDIHLAGTFLLLDHDEVYNTALVVAPDGQSWRYDKNYPWSWERAYFREGQGITVADTNLGKLGMMICWDYAHRELWERYAGKVDAMVIMSCPPDATNMDVVFEDGIRLGVTRQEDYYAGQDMPFGAELDQQAAWMRVPVVHTAGSGQFKSRIPMAMLSAAVALARTPDNWKYLLKANKAQLETGYYPQTKIINAEGRVVERVTTEGDGFVIAEVELADVAPQPLNKQPGLGMKPAAYIASDWISPAVMTWAYRRGLRRNLGARMAPVDRRTRQWGAALFGVGIIGWILGRLRR